MGAVEIAEARAMCADDPQAFRRGFQRGLHAGDLLVDSERELRALIKVSDLSGVAGFLEGLAAAHAEAGMPTTSADPFWRRNAMRTRRVAA